MSVTHPIGFKQVFKDISGQSFGSWTALCCFSKYPSTPTKWTCKCVCGSIRVFSRQSLINENPRCMFCIRRHRLLNRKKRPFPVSSLQEFKIWKGMKRRCCRPNDKDHHLYFDRGITVCQEWITSFYSFLNHIGPRPSKKHSIDRIDNNSGYRPGNVRWVTQKTQGRNTRINRLITVNGITQPLAAWAEQTGLNRVTISKRIDAGYPIKHILSTEKHIHRMRKKL